MNPYARFVELLPKVSSWIGRVVLVSSNGKVVVEIPGSNTQVQVMGDGSNTYSTNDYVYIVNNTITGKTPVLQTLLEEEII